MSRPSESVPRPLLRLENTRTPVEPLTLPAVAVAAPRPVESFRGQAPTALRTRCIAVVVNWNGGTSVVECVAALIAEGQREQDVVVVDNGSQDGSLRALLVRWPALETLSNGANIGFGHAANQGLERALQQGAERILFVNDDLSFDPGCLATLHAALDARPSLGMVGPVLLQAGSVERLWAAGGCITHRQNVVTLRGHGRLDGSRWRRDHEVDFLPACALLARAEVFRGGERFDGSMFAYFEDVDLCVRARAAGWTLACVGRATARHEGARSTGGGYGPGRKYMLALNSVRFLRRHGDARAWARFALFDVGSLPFAFALGLPRGRGRAVWAKARGLYDGLRGRCVTPERLQREVDAGR